MVKFMSRGSEHGECGLLINRWGVEVTDKKIIKLLRESPNNGFLFFEVENEEDIRKKTIDFAKHVLAMEKKPVEVEPISGIREEEMAEEVAFAEENTRLKKEREQAEQDFLNERKEAHDRQTEQVREALRDKRGRKNG